MSTHLTQTLAKWCYGRLLMLYPHAFHDEFAADMQADFADALASAQQRGQRAVLALVARETFGLLCAAVAERWRSTPMVSDTQPRLGWAGTAFALGPFFLFLFVIVLSGLRLLLPEWVGMFLLGFLIVSLLMGLARGVPDWCLPYAGLVIGAGGLYALDSAYRILRPLFDLIDAPWWYNLLSAAMVWWIAPFAVPLVLALTALIGPLRPFYARVREDWTLLSFALYGSLPVALLITFDEYVGDEPFLIAATLVLILGGYLFLRAQTVRGRALLLTASIVLAMGIAALGKSVLFSRQEWAWRFPLPNDAVVPWGEVSATLVTLGWGLVFIILFPALLDWILALVTPAPRRAPQELTKSDVGVSR